MRNWQAAIRTLVQALVGALVTWATKRGFEVDESTRLLVEGALFAGATTGAAYVMRLLPRKFPKLFGWLDFLSERKVIPADVAHTTDHLVVPRQPEVSSPMPEHTPRG